MRAHVRVCASARACACVSQQECERWDKDRNKKRGIQDDMDMDGTSEEREHVRRDEKKCRRWQGVAAKLELSSSARRT
eukprot:2601557-Pleurochrysis_carterae.AAC.1